ncbi:hypothetical protein [Nocardioides panacis]|nr:hypothetical protein [Nocardioides panacis]
MSTTQLLLELEPVVETNLNRHLSMAKEWFPPRVRPVERRPQLRRPAQR